MGQSAVSSGYRRSRPGRLRLGDGSGYSSAKIPSSRSPHRYSPEDNSEAASGELLADVRPSHLVRTIVTPRVGFAHRTPTPPAPNRCWRRGPASLHPKVSGESLRNCEGTGLLRLSPVATDRITSRDWIGRTSRHRRKSPCPRSTRSWPTP